MSENKKSPMPWATLTEKWTEFVTVRPWSQSGNRYLDPHANQPAYPVKLAGQDGWALKAIFLFEPGSLIVQGDGTTWQVASAHAGDSETRCVVQKVG